MSGARVMIDDFGCLNRFCLWAGEGAYASRRFYLGTLIIDWMMVRETIGLDVLTSVQKIPMHAAHSCPLLLLLNKIGKNFQSLNY